MKNFISYAFSALLLFSCLFSQAQDKKIPVNDPDYNKPKLFADLPQKMNLQITQLANLFDFAVGSSVNVQVTENLLILGTVVSKSDEKDISIKTVVIRSTNKQGAILTFSKTINNEEVSYRGRIMSRDNGDAFDIIQEKGQYFLQKKNLYDIISE